MSTESTDHAEPSQLQAYLDQHGNCLLIGGREYRFEDLKPHDVRGTVADVYTARAKYLGARVRGGVTGRPGAESWAIFRTTGGGARLTKFTIHNGNLIELA